MPRAKTKTPGQVLQQFLLLEKCAEPTCGGAMCGTSRRKFCSQACRLRSFRRRRSAKALADTLTAAPAESTADLIARVQREDELADGCGISFFGDRQAEGGAA